ncbi:hypothetical protein JAAARDRAFT_461676 [Jaapia argillacea MUCL 33604]|uniref:Uncharacterized protein n=1 Tax=Jaapia argillacea MUCL 33604 TaxID=933084 RepID=A0A067QG70_9AGAM|nr:hypothetical protein JAAARDRAFT_461676 [Jaapia argillacea MUCL 33604]
MPPFPLVTQSQYDTAKDIVLDLLGWGVPPAYLMDCGLSREIVFYVFTELNLRLPDGFDVDGLLPHHHPSAPNSPVPTASLAPPISQPHLQGPPPPLPSSQPPPPSRPEPSATQSRLPSGHPSLPPKPVVVPPPAPVPAPLPSKPVQAALGTTNSPMPTSPSSPSASTSLLDIEQQRRQELLARKAVQASRKLKPTTDTSMSTPPTHSFPDSSIRGGEDLESMATIPHATVDDFLNSIGPTTRNDKGKAKAAADVDGFENNGYRSSSHEDMDIDDDIPGFSNGLRSLPSALSVHSSVSSVNSLTPEFASPALGPPPSSADSAASSVTSVATVVDRWDDVIENGPSYVNGSMLPPNQRRGLKRPVAADFVDLEPTQPRSHHHHNGHSNGHHHPHLRRKTGSFASVSGMRRCVIDLSDSEDDGGFDSDFNVGFSDTDNLNSIPMPVPHHPRPSRLSSRVASPPSQSPAALFEKEREIQRMKEIIAKREEKLRKQAELTSRPPSTIPTTSISTLTFPGGSPSTSPLTPPIKVEDHEGGSANGWPEVQNGSAVPPPSTNACDDNTDEDAVMRDLTTPGGSTLAVEFISFKRNIAQKDILIHPRLCHCRRCHLKPQPRSVLISSVFLFSSFQLTERCALLRLLPLLVPILDVIADTMQHPTTGEQGE